MYRLLVVCLALLTFAPSGLPSSLVRERSAPADLPETAADRITLGDATFDRAGGHFGGFTIALAAVGRGDGRAEMARGAPEARGAEVQYRRAPGVTEWWRSLARGLEHGVTIAARPLGEGPLVLELDAADAEVVDEGRGALRLSRDGARARYAELLVVDAGGARVPARLSAAGHRMHITIDDERARYPLLVDPLFVVTPEARLEASTSCGVFGFGRSASLSADGNRALVGAPDMPTCLPPPLGIASGTGGAFVFARGAGGTWTQEAELRSLQTENEHAGTSVAIDADGDVAVLLDVAARVAVHHRSGTTWALHEYLSVPAGCRSVSISSDGRRLAVGCPTAAERVLLFEDTTGAFTRATFPDVAMGAGTVVALSADGRRLLVTDPSRQQAYVYRDSGTWSLDAARDTLRPMGAAVEGLGTTGTLSRSGLRAILGSTFSGITTAYAFSFDGTAWRPDGTLSADVRRDAELATSLAISDDGARAAVGVPGDVSGGSVRLFGRSAGAWIEDEASLYPAAPTPARFGDAVAFSLDAARVLVGASADDSAEVFSLADGARNGASCGAGSECLSGNCVVGMCCDADCDESDSSCTSCRAAETGRADGTCAPRLAATVCRDSTGPCDPAEVCDGVMPTCPIAAFAVSGTTCRPSAGDCDPAEVCDGARAVCPGDVLAPSGARCGVDPTSCSTPGTCDGRSPTCGGTSEPLPLGTLCGPRDPRNPCDADDACNGTGVCVQQSAPATTPCGIIAPDGACDGPDHCDGMSPTCVPGRLAGIECRAATGTCDVAEGCAGISADCPPDGLLAPGVTCRASVDACDPAESCEGSAACPPDVNMCVPDAGAEPDAGGATDGGAEPRDAPSPDAGGPVPTAGCACRVSPTGSPLPLLGLLLGAALLLRRR